MPAENESPAREPATRGRGRGGRGSRGGRGRGGSRLSTVAAVARLPSSPSQNPAVAAYERQRDLKATYQAVAHAIKPALQELAERAIDEALAKPDHFKSVPEYLPVVRELQDRYQNRLAVTERRMKCDMELAKATYEAEVLVAEREFQNAVDDMEEQFYEGQENRIRILGSLNAKGLPVDVSPR
ncbi:hypothetical protein NQ176_g6248 [Zarea fungicola]|uniref:Uncharacterized protein n=1 Tax=Zarea fungicola TaxID=93591 RepID=A0ACC1N6J8_9HYPO|nr:hypothetical protein NQ176_g6248 [Lecanicillium fungicola]